MRYHRFIRVARSMRRKAAPEMSEELLRQLPAAPAASGKAVSFTPRRAAALSCAAVLAGLVLNAALGWWWADPVVALGLAVVAVREGREAWRGHLCCARPTPVSPVVGCSDGCCS